MQIEYKIKFENGGVTITQTVEPNDSMASMGSTGPAIPSRQLASTLVETQHLDRLAAVAGGTSDPPGGKGGGTSDPPGGKGGGTSDPPGGKGGGTSDPPGGKGGGTNDPPGGKGGGTNDPPGGKGGGTNDSPGGKGGGHAAAGHQRGSGSGKVTAVILGPLVITDSTGH